MRLKPALKNRSCRAVIACVGSWLRGDDALGLVVYELLKASGVECLVECEYGLENCVHRIKELSPRLVVIVDAIYSPGLNPGDLVLARAESIVEDYMPHTHRLSVDVMAHYVRESIGPVDFIVVGLVAESTSLGLGLSRRVRSRLKLLLRVLEAIYKTCNRSGLTGLHQA